MTTDTDALLTSLKRTLIPIVVGAVAASFVGPHIDQSALRDLLAGLIAGGYYTVIRFVEVRFPEAGLLLGAMRQPTY
jgi:hypothetical protein